jgi:hypothetical protein
MGGGSFYATRVNTFPQHSSPTSITSPTKDQYMNKKAYLSTAQMNNLNNMTSSLNQQKGSTPSTVQELEENVNLKTSLQPRQENQQPQSISDNVENKAQKRSGETTGFPIPPSKKRKLHVVKPTFDVLYADFLLKLEGPTYFLYGVNSEGVPIIRVQDCAYHINSASFKNSHHDNFVPRSVKFTPQQWDDMIASVEDISKGYRSEESSRIHIGGNTFITVKPERGVIDIREYFLPEKDGRSTDVPPEEFFDELVPTRRGVILSFNAWKVLVEKADQLLKDFAGERIQWNGDCIASHIGEVSLMKCGHCNPNGYKFWNKQ